MTQFSGKKTKHIFGKIGESTAALHLEAQGYTIIASNYKKSFGEIDLIAKQDKTVVFIEVKTRNNTIVPLESLISPVKQRRIIQTAKLFISEYNIIDTILRFDVILIQHNNGKIQCNHIQSAFLSDE